MLPKRRYDSTEPILIATSRAPLNASAMMKLTNEAAASKTFASPYGAAQGLTTSPRRRAHQSPNSSHLHFVWCPWMHNLTTRLDKRYTWTHFEVFCKSQEAEGLRKDYPMRQSRVSSKIPAELPSGTFSYYCSPHRELGLGPSCQFANIQIPRRQPGPHKLRRCRKHTSWMANHIRDSDLVGRVVQFLRADAC